MAPLNPNVTSRLFVEYTSDGIQHEMVFRFGNGAVPGDALDTVSPILDAMAEMMRENDNFTSARWSNTGDDFSFPIPFLVLEGRAANTLSGVDPQSRFMSFVGRDAIVGRRYRVEFFSASSVVPTPLNNRIPRGDSELVDAILAQLETATLTPAGGTAIVTIGGQVPIFNQYANVAFNAYWQRKQRRSGA